MAGIAVGDAFEIILVLRFGLPEIASRRNLGDRFARPQTGGVNIGDGVQRNTLLFGVGVEDRRAITGPDIVALAVGCAVERATEQGMGADSEMAGTVAHPEK